MAFQTTLTNNNDSVQVPTSGQYVGDWRLYALDGNDTVIGYTGNDTFYGGYGDDLYYHDFATSGITVIDDQSGNEINNADILYAVNTPSKLNLRFGADHSTLYVFQDGQWNGSGIDNGIIIKGALRNDGTEYVGTVENAYFNGSAFSNWLPLVHSAWNALYP